MSARRVVGGILVASPFAGLYGGALWAAWGTPYVWSLILPVVAAGVIWLGVHLLMTEPKPKREPLITAPTVRRKPVLLDVSRDPQRHPRDETGRFIERGERG